LNPFPEVLDVSSEWMVKREELTMLVKRRKLVTPLQPSEPHNCLAYWAWELLVNTPRAEYAIHQEVMQGVVVPHMHCEVLLCSSVICQYPLFLIKDQFINERLHEHTHLVPRVSRNYQ
jgi:hypothetical protein